MAIIYSYPLATPELTDLIIGTQVGSGNPTKTFTVQSIADLTTGVKKIIAGSDISISPTDGVGEVTINCTLDPGVTSLIAGANISLSPSSGVGDVNISVTGVVTGVTSGNTDTITIGGTATAPSPAVENNMVSSNVRDGNPTGDIRNNHPTPSCSGTMEFNGTTMTWTKDNVNDVVKLEIDGPDGGQIIEMPLNDFQF